ncbi:hypothetical protein CS063_02450 [Sporanaerobium hydrogeniformans]|uniref:Uncharacterized protein n=1 Tax=Sporanaerobium hydrogeniformans TaxID=3072179 RepID=A0AC61DHU0_9FIRM|nr:stage III sporulation protein AE [Sporanaerobium hydrogeniformans]PHV72358.1 hypothetical protein CS063_02450 [Sporanaerobium hydrogeniformans]
MKRKKILGLGLLLFCLFGISPLYGAEVEDIQTKEQEEQILEYQLNFFNWQGIEEMEKSLKETMPTLESFDLKQEVQSLIKGEKSFSLDYLIKKIGSSLFQELGVFIRLGARFILIVLLCNLLQTLSSSFESKGTTQISFFVCYLVIIYSVMQSLLVMVDLASRTISGMNQVMTACIPTLIAFMTTSGYGSSGYAMAPVISSALTLSTYFLQKLVLPSIISVILLQLISTMSDSFKIDKLIDLFYRLMKWVLRGVLIVAIGVLSVYKATLPYVDMTVKKAAISVSKTFIPIVGDAVGGAVDFMMNCSFLVKNSFCIGVMLLVISLVSIPLIKILAYCLIYHVAGAVIEPLGDKRMASLATHLAKGCEFIMSTVGVVAILCLFVLVICMGVGTQRLEVSDERVFTNADMGHALCACGRNDFP